MLMVPGANGEADIFTMVTEHLAAHYTVVTYDRRGFSRSQLDGPQDYDHRLETDANDVRRLIEHLSDEPATVFGTSSGGVVHELRQYSAVDLDLDALTAHADRIVPVAGRESLGYPIYEVNVELGKKLGRDLIELPGGHVGYATQPAEFAREFVQALARTGHGPR